VFKTSTEIPQVTVKGSSVTSAYSYDSFIAVAKILAPACENAEGSTIDLDYEWVLSSKPGEVGDPYFQFSGLVNDEVTLTVPSENMIPGAEYKFTIRAWVADSAELLSTASLVVHIEPTPTPSLLHGQFSDDVTRLILNFDVPTNQPGETKQNCAFFDQSTLSLLGTSPTCIWSERQTLQIVLGYGATVEVGDMLAMEDGVLRSADQYSEFATGMSTKALAPTTPIVPTAVIAGPEQIGNCETLTLFGDMSSGNAGRALNFEWSVVPTAETGLTPREYAAINAVASQTKSPTFVASPSQLIPNRLYHWRLEVTNWLGKSHATTLQVFKARMAVPRIRLYDSAVRYIRKEESLTAVVQLEASECDPTQQLLMNWEQITDHNYTLAAQYLNQTVLAQNKIFYLEKGSLSPGLTYTFRITVIVIQDQGLYNTADLTINVATSPIEAAIFGGDRIHSMSTAPGHIELDASASLDPDDPISSGMKYQWSCTFKSRGQACFSGASMAAVGFAFNKTGDPILIVPPALLQATADIEVPNWDDTEAYNFTVAVSESDRVSSTSVLVTTTTELVPSVTVNVRSNIYHGKHTVGNKLSLESQANSSAANPTWEIVWTCTSNNFVMGSENFATALTSQNLVFKAGVLSPGVEYTFMVQYVNTNLLDPKVGQATVNVVTNAGPSQGTCFAEPPSGRLLTTSFELKCLDWTDHDTPLEYRFSVVEGNAKVSIGVFQGKNSLTTDVLPVGPESTNYTHTIQATIRDNLGSSSVFDFTVQVLPLAAEMGVYQAMGDISVFASNAASSADPISFSQAVVTATSLLGQGNVTATAETEIRENLLGSMVDMVSNTYATTTDTLEQQAQLTSELCNNPDGLNSDTAVTCSGLAGETAGLALGDGTELTRDTAQAVVDTFSSVFNVTNTTTNTSQTLVAGFRSTTAYLGHGLLANAVPGEDVVTVSSDSLYLEAAVLPAELSSVSIGGGLVALNDDMSSLLGGGAVESTYVVTGNIYEHIDEPNASEAASGVVSFSLFSQESGEELVVENVETPIVIIISHAPIENWSLLPRPFLTKLPTQIILIPIIYYIMFSTYRTSLLILKFDHEFPCQTHACSESLVELLTTFDQFQRITHHNSFIICLNSSKLLESKPPMQTRVHATQVERFDRRHTPSVLVF
jgi:hypothetical protein